jgi:murein DD-endopeptidase MepM/ murein hydrolase activator NlpD
VTRFGALMLLLFAAVIGGFFLVVRHGRLASAPAASTAASTGPASPSALVIPVADVQASQLSDTWGQGRGDGTREHHAIDIVAPRGTPVVAAADGTVEKLFESKDGGHTVYIRRTDPAWIDYYAHLDTYAPDLREGVTVRQGQPLGTVGSTGDADPAAPHLHYEIKHMGAGEKWWQGTDVNPYPILRAAAPPA